MFDSRPRGSQFLSLIHGDYPTRMLLGLLGSLGILLTLLHIPVRSGTGAFVGWSSSFQQRIPISEIERGEEADETTSKETRRKKNNDAPPPTRQGPVAENLRPGSSNDGGQGSEGDAERDEQERGRGEKSVVHIAELAGTANEPNMVGGRGALYLQISYPYEARMKGIEGRLKLGFTVTKTGDVRRIDVEKSLHPLCDSAAVRALRSVRFRPATQRGEPVPVRMSLPIRFELEKPDTTAVRATRGSEG